MVKFIQMKSFRLYVDESGVHDLNHFDKNFTLCGIVVNQYQAENLKIKADQIKFKYWNNTDIVFHSHEIGAKKNDFAILKDPTINKNFLTDLLIFLNTTGYHIIVVSINKDKAKALGWTSDQILDIANDNLIEIFLEYLASDGNKGQIVMESSSAKDIAFYKRYAKYLSHGFPKLSLTPDNVKKTLTSLSFVSKNNHDIESQLADLFAYPATCKFLHDENIKTMAASSYEQKICNIMSAKVISIKGAKKGFLRLP